MIDNKILDKILRVLYTIFHLPSAFIYIIHIIFVALYNVLGSNINSFNYERFMNEQYDEAKKYMDNRNYIDYTFWVILFIYINIR